VRPAKSKGCFGYIASVSTVPASKTPVGLSFEASRSCPLQITMSLGGDTVGVVPSHIKIVADAHPLYSFWPKLTSMVRETPHTFGSSAPVLLGVPELTTSNGSQKMGVPPSCILQLPDAGGITVTLANADADPPPPEHVRVYAELAVGETVSEPLTVCVPLQLPDAEQLVAFVELHVSVEDWPVVIDVGVAVRVMGGVRGGATTDPTPVGRVTTPTFPMQVPNRVCEFASGPNTQCA
jgi:hypothetical protein